MAVAVRTVSNVGWGFCSLNARRSLQGREGAGLSFFFKLFIEFLQFMAIVVNSVRYLVASSSKSWPFPTRHDNFVAAANTIRLDEYDRTA